MNRLAATVVSTAATVELLHDRALVMKAPIEVALTEALDMEGGAAAGAA